MSDTAWIVWGFSHFLPIAEPCDSWDEAVRTAHDWDHGDGQVFKGIEAFGDSHRIVDGGDEELSAAFDALDAEYAADALDGIPRPWCVEIIEPVFMRHRGVSGPVPRGGVDWSWHETEDEAITDAAALAAKYGTDRIRIVRRTT